MMKNFMKISMLFIFVMIVACSGKTPEIIPTEGTDFPDSINQPDEEHPEKPDDITNPSDCLENGKSCQVDDECCGICADGKCTDGCTSDADCSNYKNTQCNKELGRCLNVTGSSGACSESKCKKGCCTTNAGLTSLKCNTTANLNICGICPQGKIYNGKTCVSPACDTDETCQGYNSGETYPDCFECSKSNDLCKENRTASCTGSGTVVNVAQCVPAGEACIDGESTCCSGQPCIQGYCY